MKFGCALFVVEDIEKSKAFYKEVLGLRTVMDLGANATLKGGLSLQTRKSYAEFIGRPEHEIRFRGNDTEIYFEEEDFDGFAQKLGTIPGLQYVHPVQEHSWGQRVVRFYDPDHHIIEVGEDIKTVCRRFLDSGLTIEETAERMDVPVKYVKAYSRKRGAASGQVVPKRAEPS